ncbi:hypothetical protein ALP29_200926 [Pseudomonas syringae pv. avii]|uniref:Uncharacterized protein n=1 Tax=Pseudomonas syringae pv. avii TaxID=663959 RepID=A0A3M5U8L0_PSESX|nr:hypothetical protein ALP29_200926 [Pseudomonas syringae pv. avii]
MDGFHAAQADVQCAIHRRGGRLEDADHGKRLVVVLDQADRRNAVRQYQFVAELVMQRSGDFRAKDNLKRIGLKRTPFSHLQVLLAAELIMLEVRLVGAHHPVATVRVAQRNRYSPFDLFALGKVLEAVPANVVGGVTDAEHRIQQQIERAGARADDQVGAADGAGEAGAGFGAHPLDGQ